MILHIVPSNFTYSEAAEIAGLTPHIVHKEIELGTVTVDKTRSLRLDKIAVLCLLLEGQGVKHFPPRIRKDVFRKIRQNPRIDQIRPGEAITIDVASARRELDRRISEMQAVKRMVLRDKKILGGMPVFRGTTVPVRPVLDMLDSGISAAKISAAYPSLTEKMVLQAAPYAKALVPRGRPPLFPWKIAAPAKGSKKAKKAASSGE